MPLPGGQRLRPPARRGCLWFFLILLALLFAGGVYLVYKVSRSLEKGLTGGEADEFTVVEERISSGSGARKIAVIDVHGLIVSGAGYGRGAVGATALCRLLDKARKDRSVAAVILDLDSPGGEVTAADEIHYAVQRLRKAGKPVVTCMHSLGASGAYYIACGTDWIVANPTTLTGSIGVIIHALNYRALFDKIGLRADVYKSGAMKDLLNGAREPTPEEKRYVESLVRETFTRFAEVVAEGRRIGQVEDVLAAPWSDGRILSGRQAIEYRLIDQIGYFQDAVDKARALASAPDARIVRYRRPSPLIEFLFSKTSAGPLDGLIPASWRFLRPGCLYYVMPGSLP